MLLTVKKQIEETAELKTPAYYKDWIGNFHFINEAGQLISTRKKMITIWDPQSGKAYTEEIETLLRNGNPCAKEDFEKAYKETIETIQAAVDGVVINS